MQFSYATYGIIDGDYCIVPVYTGGNSGHGELVVYNYVTNEKAIAAEHVYTYFNNVSVERSDNEIKISYDTIHSQGDVHGLYRIYNKENNEISDEQHNNNYKVLPKFPSLN